MMRQEKFYRFIGIGNLDKGNKRTLVYSPKEEKLYIATTKLKVPVLPTSLGVFASIALYTYLGDKTTSGLSPLLLSLGFGLAIGGLVALSFLAITVQIHDFDESTLDLPSFLIEQMKLIKQLWRVLSFLLILTLLTATIYLLTDEVVFLVGAGMIAFTLSLLYFTGLHGRKRVIDKLLVEGGL